MDVGQGAGQLACEVRADPLVKVNDNQVGDADEQPERVERRRNFPVGECVCSLLRQEVQQETRFKMRVADEEIPVRVSPSHLTLFLQVNHLLCAWVAHPSTFSQLKIPRSLGKADVQAV